MKKENLPNKISVFPLSSAIFFPRTVLPLNIFEKRYIQLVEDSMKGSRIFGMVQPKTKIGITPEVYDVGCLGKITSFNETNDGRFIITLSGLIRFKIRKELERKKLYRNFEVDYSDFLNDLEIKKLNHENEDKKNLIKYIEKGEIKPLVAKTYPLKEIKKAQEEFLLKKHVGKLVLLP